MISPYSPLMAPSVDPGVEQRSRTRNVRALTCRPSANFLLLASFTPDISLLSRSIFPSPSPSPSLSLSLSLSLSHSPLTAFSVYPIDLHLF